MKMSTARLKTLARRLGARLDDEPARAVLIRRLRVALPLAYPRLHAPRVNLTDFQRALDFLHHLARLGSADDREYALEGLMQLLSCDRLVARERAVALLGELSSTHLAVALDEQLCRVDAKRRSAALRLAIRELGRGAEGMVRRAFRDPDRDVQRVAVWTASRWLLALDGSALEPLTQHSDYGIRVQARAFARFGTEIDSLVRGAFHRDRELQDGARYVLSSASREFMRTHRVPVVFREYAYYYGAMSIAVALWRRQPIGWRVPAWLRGRTGKADRKLIRRLHEIALRYHRGVILYALRRRPPRARQLARQRERLLGALLERAREGERRRP